MSRIVVACCNCSKEVSRQPSTVKEGVNVFCSKSCAAKYNNKKFPKRMLENACNICKKSISSSRTFCSECYAESANYDFTLSECIDKPGSNKYGFVRYRARKCLPEKCACQVCGYEKHVEVCHKKAIRDFPLEAKLSEINSKDNLLFLCPNCHWELDNNYLSF